MLRALVFLLVLAAGTARSTDAGSGLTYYYEQYNQLFDVTTFNPSQLCYDKWERTERLFGRNSQKRSYLGCAPYDVNGTVLLVHVGKAGGGTLENLFKTSGVSWQSLHIHALDTQMIHGFELIVLNLRDPVQRLISAFNFRNPRVRRISADWYHCGEGKHKDFYKCFKTLDEYAEALTADDRCGKLARRGECHTELDTCAYLGGVVDELERNKQKVFVVDTSTLMADAEKLFNRLEKKLVISKNAHVNTHDLDITKLHNTSGLAKLIGHVELMGEGFLYRWLLQVFR